METIFRLILQNAKQRREVLQDAPPAFICHEALSDRMAGGISAKKEVLSTNTYFIGFLSSTEIRVF